MDRSNRPFLTSSRGEPEGLAKQVLRQPMSQPPASAPAAERAWPHELLRLPVHLDGGEIIILAVKPSAWFVVLDASNWLLIGLLLASSAGWISAATGWISHLMLLQASLACVTLRLGIAVLRWVSRFYVLTNRRIMRISGVWKVDVFACPLLNIRTTKLTQNVYERWVRCGSLRFNLDPPLEGDSTWRLLHHPEEVHAHVRRAIQRAIDGHP